MSEPIDIFARMKVKRAGGKFGGNGARMTMTWTAPDVVFDADERRIAGDMAQALAESIKEALFRGELGPAPSAGTLERREYRVEQASRGGAPAPRHVSHTSNRTGERPSKVQASVLKHWAQRFKATKLGLFLPKDGAKTWGVESGMMASSVVAEPQKDGSFGVFFAVARGRIDRSGQSAVQRVLSRIPGLVQHVARDPRMATAKRKVLDSLLVSRLEAALAAARTAARAAMGLANELEQEDEL